MRSSLLVTFLSTVFVAGCNQQPTSTGDAAVQSKLAKAAVIDQTQLCQVAEWGHDAVASSCTPGQKVVFLPNSFGNEQLPVIFAAVNCDLRYTVALTKGAVTCIYNPIQPAPAPAPAPAQPAAADASQSVSKP